VAVEHLRKRGGALINIGSEVSDVAVPLQGIYSASKHAVKGYTDALRLELEHAGAPVSVTLVKPAALDTPYLPHAKNFLEVEPRLAPPVYAPEIAASAILYAAQRPRRDVYVGGASKMASASSRFAPRTTDWLLKKSMFWLQRTDRPARQDGDGLHQAAGELLERHGARTRVREWSVYTQAAIHPKITAAVMLGLLFAAGYWLTSQPPRRPWTRRISFG
jgi:hypothetical protein